MGALLVAMLLVPRPVLSGAEQTLATADGAFLIHSTNTGIDSVVHAEDPAAVRAGLETVYSHWVTRVGMRAPLGDGGLGGDARIDVYLRKLDGPRGNTWPEEVGMGDAASAWIELDPRSALKSETRLAAAAGHEAHHAIQYAYSTGLSRWVYEATAAYVENSDFDGMQAETDAHYAAILSHPEEPLDTVDGSHEYDEMAFIRGVIEDFGVVRGIGEDRLAVLWTSMAAKRDAGKGIEDWGGRDLSVVLADYGLWLLGACERGGLLPDTCRTSASLRIIGLPLPSVTEIPLPPLAFAWVRIPNDGGGCPPATLQFVGGDDLVFEQANYLFPRVVSGAGPIVADVANDSVVARGRGMATTVTITASANLDDSCHAPLRPHGNSSGCQCATGGEGPRSASMGLATAVRLVLLILLVAALRRRLTDGKRFLS